MFAGVGDKGAPHAEARARSVAVLFMLLLSQVLIVPAVHHFQLPAWPKQWDAPPNKQPGFSVPFPLSERSVNKAWLVLNGGKKRKQGAGAAARMSERAKGR